MANSESAVVTRARMVRVAQAHTGDHATASAIVDAILDELRQAKTVSLNVPTIDDYFTRAHLLAKLVRKRLDGHSVKRGEMRRVLEQFEQIDYKAM